MREKEMQRKQQEASGFQQQSNFYSCKLDTPPPQIICSSCLLLYIEAMYLYIGLRNICYLYL